MTSVLDERAGARPGRAAGKRRSTILLVGAEAGCLGQYARSFEAYGYAVDFAPDGATAIRLTGEKDFDVIVSDIDEGGFCDGESLRHLREQNHCVPVVVLSSGLAFASARAALDCGADKYLLKPVSDDQLLEVLVEAMRDASLRL